VGIARQAIVVRTRARPRWHDHVNDARRRQRVAETRTLVYPSDGDGMPSLGARSSRRWTDRRRDRSKTQHEQGMRRTAAIAGCFAQSMRLHDARDRI